MTIVTSILFSLLTPVVLDVVPNRLPSIQDMLPSTKQEDVNQYVATDKQVILASWYGPGFDGNLTANGETFNQYDLTVASPNLPFNTMLEITYKGKSVVARVNDRGPFPHVKGEYYDSSQKRGIDLSKGTAQAIGFDGVDEVQVTILSRK